MPLTMSEECDQQIRRAVMEQRLAAKVAEIESIE